LTERTLLEGSRRDKPQGPEEQFTQAMTEIHSVVPGVFALFGFQLIAAFNDVFQKQLAPVEKALYLLALVLLASSAAMLMTPAAYHRQVRPHSVSDAFANLVSKLLVWAMAPLLCVFPLDGYLVTRIVSNDVAVAVAVGAFVAVVFTGAWLVFPILARRRHDMRRAQWQHDGEELHPM
jgi:multisubunit Na+/H+ antiporter MnhG subunit